MDRTKPTLTTPLTVNEDLLCTGGPEVEVATCVAADVRHGRGCTGAAKLRAHDRDACFGALGHIPRRARIVVGTIGDAICRADAEAGAERRERDCNGDVSELHHVRGGTGQQKTRS